MSEEEQEKLYELLFKDTKNKLEATIEKQQKEIKELKREKDISISVMNTKSMFLESISKELGLTDEKTEGFVFTDIIKEIRKLKKIIDKQQKEIKELKEKNASLKKQIKLMQSCDLAKVIKKQEKEIEALEIIHTTYKEMIEENGYISKDKIRAKIKELENLYKNKYFHIDYVKEILEELLEENNKCK